MIQQPTITSTPIVVGMPIPPMELQDQFFSVIERQINLFLNKTCRLGNKPPLHKLCWLWAAYTVAELGLRNTFGAFQAGTALWPRVPIDKIHDQTILHTHFGCQFDPAEAMKTLIDQDCLPEMHCWVVIPNGPDQRYWHIVDPLAGFFPLQCKELLNEDWPGILPPKRLWCYLIDLPKANVYHAFPLAKQIAHAFMEYARTGEPITLVLRRE